MNAQATAPECFGTHLWSATDPQCVGGTDPGYLHPVTKTRNRERCKWYQSCATSSAQNRAKPAQVVPAQNLVRPKHPTVFQPAVQPPPRPVAPHPNLTGKPPLHPPPVAMQQYPGQPLPPPQYYGQPQQQQAVLPGSPIYGMPAPAYVPPHVAQAGPVNVPLQVQQPGAQMPSYLTMPEPIDHEEGTAKALGRTLFRSAAKAVGHSVSSFFDHVPLKPHKPPPVQ
jgi:hypothetical protein